LFGESIYLLHEGVNGLQIGTGVVNCPQGLFIELQVLFEILQVVIPLESLPLEELYFVLLGLVSNKDFLDVADVVILHGSIIISNIMVV